MNRRGFLRKTTGVAIGVAVAPFVPRPAPDALAAAYFGEPLTGEDICGDAILGGNEGHLVSLRPANGDWRLTPYKVWIAE